MNPSELVDYVRSGPTDLVLDKPLRSSFPFPSRPHANEFLQADDQNCHLYITATLGYLRRRVGTSCQGAWEYQRHSDAHIIEVQGRFPIL
jgi:hypothetical protein